MKTRRTLFFLLSFVLLTAGLASAQDAVTLTVWDNFTRDAEQEMIEELNQQFEEAHPGVTVERTPYETGDLTTVLPLELSASDAPDVVMINQGIANMGALVQEGLILPVDEYAEQFGWLDRYGAGLHQRNRFTEGAEQFGEGNLYGVSNSAEVVGVYYHKGIFEDLGLEIPTTLEEFESVMQTLKDAGITPLIFGSLDGWPAIHEYGAILNAYATPEEVNSLIYRFEDGRVNTDAALQAAQVLTEWANNGYFPEGFEGIDYDAGTATSMFVNGEGAMWLTGSWMTPTLIEEMDAESIGFFLLPDAAGSEVPLTTGGVGLAFGIPANSDQPDLAAEYIDWVTSPEAAAQLFEAGLLPAAPIDPELVPEGSVVGDVVNAWNAIAQNDRVGHYLDWTIPGSDLIASLQELLGGQVTPEEFVADVQQVYEDSAP